MSNLVSGAGGLSLHPNFTGAGVPETPPPAAPVSRLSVWKSRIFMVIFVVFCIEMGMLLAVLPWTKMWTTNGFLERYPAWRPLLLSDFLRGVVSGLGLVDVWLGISQAIRYHDPGWQPKQQSGS